MFYFVLPMLLLAGCQQQPGEETRGLLRSSQWRRESHLCASLRENPGENFKLNKKHQGFSWQSSKAYQWRTRRLLRSSQWRKESYLCASLRENFNRIKYL